MAVISSVSTKSSGFSTPAVKYTEVTMDRGDGNPHPNASGVPAEDVGKDSGGEYHETPSAGIEKTGVGSMTQGNDAAHETIVKHP
jgi:hypothetical protein